jgi:hypothetical protein
MMSRRRHTIQDINYSHIKLLYKIFTTMKIVNSKPNYNQQGIW